MESSKRTHKYNNKPTEELAVIQARLIGDHTRVGKLSRSRAKKLYMVHDILLRRYEATELLLGK